MRHGMAIIGLGVIGRRMIEQATRHRALRVASAWDASPTARDAAARDFPGLPMAADAGDAIARPEVAVVYVGTPPRSHRALVEQAARAGKAVFCEKPLAVSLADGEAMVEAVRAAGVAHAVNFPFASSESVRLLAQALAQPDFGLAGAAVRMRFSAWPRDWQASATWLSQAAEGGPTREVLSHWVYLLQELFGEVELLACGVDAPVAGACERASAALLRTGGVLATMSAQVGGAAPDEVVAEFHGAGRTLRLRDWHVLTEAGGADGAVRAEAPVPGQPVDARQAVQQAQLTQLVACIEGRAHALPGFPAALRVQRIVESILRGQAS